MNAGSSGRRIYGTISLFIVILSIGSLIAISSPSINANYILKCPLHPLFFIFVCTELYFLVETFFSVCFDGPLKAGNTLLGQWIPLLAFPCEACFAILKKHQNNQRVITTLRSLPSIRSLRLFRLLALHPQYIVLCRVLKHSIHVLVPSLVSILGVGAVGGLLLQLTDKTFSNASHGHEQGVCMDSRGGKNPSPFQTLGDAFYWVVSTLCTVGYGDLIPYSSPGKALGSLFPLFGMFLLLFPSSVMCSYCISEYISSESTAIKQLHEKKHDIYELLQHMEAILNDSSAQSQNNAMSMTLHRRDFFRAREVFSLCKSLIISSHKGSYDTKRFRDLLCERVLMVFHLASKVPEKERQAFRMVAGLNAIAWIHNRELKKIFKSINHPYSI